MSGIGVLLIEDDPVDQRVVLRALRAWPEVEVTVVPDLSTACALATDRFLVDVVLLDLDLPEGESVFDTVDTVRNAYPSASVVVLSDNRSASAPRDAESAGARDFIAKAQLTAAHLTDTIYAALRAN